MRTRLRTGDLVAADRVSLALILQAQKKALCLLGRWRELGPIFRNWTSSVEWEVRGLMCTLYGAHEADARPGGDGAISM